MTLENNEFIKYLLTQGFGPSKFYVGKDVCYFDPLTKYNVQYSCKALYKKNIRIYFDYIFCSILKGKKRVFQFDIAKIPEFGKPDVFLEIPQHIIDWCKSDEPELPVDWYKFHHSRYISKKVRDAVMERDNYECVICHSDYNLEIDHIFPYSKGGSNSESNLQVLCKSCNVKKYNTVSCNP